MRLHSHAVNQILLYQWGQNLTDNIIHLCSTVLIVIIIEQFAACWCIFSCIFKRLKDIGLVTVNLYPCRLSTLDMIGASFPYRSGIRSCLIDNIPCIKFYIRVFCCKCFHHNFDIILQTLIHNLWCHPCTVFSIVLFKEPIRCLTMPYQNMSSHRNVIFCCEFQQFICTFQ